MRLTTEVTARNRADSADVAVLSPADIAIHQETTGEGRKEPPRRWTILATVLGHVLVLALFIVDWQTRPEPVPAPEPIPVRLVMLPPKPEPAPPTPPARAAPKREPKRESGPDQETTAPPPAAVEGPKASPPPETPPTAMKPPETPPVEAKPSEAPAPAAKPPEAPPVEEKPAEAPSIEEKPAEMPAMKTAPEHPAPVPAAKPKPKKNTAQSAAPPTPKPAPAPTDHLVALLPPGRAPGEAAKSGDHYLNLLRDRIERNRSYPPAEMFGVVPGAIAVYSVVVDRRGNLMGVRIVQSTGISKFDELAGLMIRDAAPFPPLPQDYPEVRALLTIAIPIFPAPH